MTATFEASLPNSFQNSNASRSSYDKDDVVRKKAATFRHDIFNLVALAIVNSLNMWYLLYGAGFETFWWATGVYFLLDFVWIISDPSCVKSPAVLLLHHIVAVAYMALPFFYPATAPKMSYVMTVEVNTWILIAKRVMPSRLLDVLFYVTWVLIRNIFFPYLIWDVSHIYIDAIQESGTIFHPLVIAPVMQTVLTVLGYQWTFQLLKRLLFPTRTSKTHQL